MNVLRWHASSMPEAHTYHTRNPQQLIPYLESKAFAVAGSRLGPSLAAPLQTHNRHTITKHNIHITAVQYCVTTREFQVRPPHTPRAAQSCSKQTVMCTTPPLFAHRIATPPATCGVVQCTHLAKCQAALQAPKLLLGLPNMGIFHTKTPGRLHRGS